MNLYPFIIHSELYDENLENVVSEGDLHRPETLHWKCALHAGPSTARPAPEQLVLY
jgi:hypothetical protein